MTPSSSRKRSSRVHRRLRTQFEGISSPETGGVYIGRRSYRYSKTPEWNVLVILPCSDFRPFGISGTMADTNLMDSKPPCYRLKGQSITGWRKNYEDNGPKVTDRRFPVLWFLDLSTALARQGTTWRCHQEAISRGSRRRPHAP